MTFIEFTKYYFIIGILLSIGLELYLKSKGLCTMFFLDRLLQKEEHKRLLDDFTAKELFWLFYSVFITLWPVFLLMFLL